MTDENKKQLGEEEYQFPSNEYVMDDTKTQHQDQLFQEEVLSVEESETSMYSGGPMSRLRGLFNRRILIALAGAAVVFIAVKIFMGVENSRPRVVSQKTIPPITAVQNTSPSPQVLNQISDLQQAALNNQTAVKEVQSEMQTLQSSVSNAQNNEEQLNQSIRALVEQVKQLNTKVNAAPRQTVQSAPVHEIQYHLIAVVPGRAWIESSDGDQMTVRAGDRLQQYGVVRQVNADAGYVLTSSGRLIKYGQDDS